VLETIGLVKGTALLTAIKNTPAFEFVRPLLEQGRLKASSPLLSTGLQSFVDAGVITAAEKAALVALGQESRNATWLECQEVYEKEGF
jgi:hypothetical protein